ncbi:Ubiquitin-Protein Ligase E3B [Manis pentadactyla]|nr:Ubiquitin-Protein Ligase E3B [Manis pentadactyla]
MAEPPEEVAGDKREARGRTPGDTLTLSTGDESESERLTPLREQQTQSEGEGGHMAACGPLQLLGLMGERGWEIKLGREAFRSQLVKGRCERTEFIMKAMELSGFCSSADGPLLVLQTAFLLLPEERKSN